MYICSMNPDVNRIQFVGQDIVRMMEECEQKSVAAGKMAMPTTKLISISSTDGIFEVVLIHKPDMAKRYLPEELSVV